MKLQYKELRRKIVFDVLDKFPETSTRSIACILMRDSSEFFDNYEHARRFIRYYRGVSGKRDRKNIAVKKYLNEKI